MDHGLFGPDSVTWRVMGEPILLSGASGPMLMQGLHPPRDARRRPRTPR